MYHIHLPRLTSMYNSFTRVATYETWRWWSSHKYIVLIGTYLHVLTEFDIWILRYWIFETSMKNRRLPPSNIQKMLQPVVHLQTLWLVMHAFTYAYLCSVVNWVFVMFYVWDFIVYLQRSLFGGYCLFSLKVGSS